MSIPVSQFIPLPFSSQYSYICSLHFCLYICFANKFIYTIFLDSTHKRYSAIFGFSLLDLLHSVWQSRGLSACMLSRFSRVQFFATYQAPLSLEFSRQEYWSGLPCPTAGDRPHPGIKFASPALQVDSSPTEPSGKPPRSVYISVNGTVSSLLWLSNIPLYICVPHLLCPSLYW